MSHMPLLRDLRRVLSIAWVGTVRVTRDRTALFFLFVFPLVLVLVLGFAFGGDSQLRLGVVVPPGDPLADEVVQTLIDRDDARIETYDTVDDLRVAVERRQAEAGVVFPDDYSAQLSEGETVELGFVADPLSVGQTLRTEVQAAVDPQTVRVQAARFGAEQTGDDFTSALAEATELEAALADSMVQVAVTERGEEVFPDSTGRFDLGASSQLLLFVFVNGMATSVVLIQSRQLGVTQRMFSTPTSVRTIVVGEALGRLVITGGQGAYIMATTWLLFGVHWGDPVAAAVLVLVFALLAGAASMLVGSIFTHPEQAQGIGVFFGLGMAALGGSMAPLEVFTPFMRRIAHVTPHAWANDAFATLTREDGGLGDILPELGVLAAGAVVLFVLASWRLRRALTNA